MNTLTLKRIPESYTIAPEKSHSRISLTRVLWAKFLRWVDGASTDALRKLLCRLAGLLLLLAYFLLPQFTLGVLTAAARWNGYRLPLFAALLVLTLNAKTLLRMLTRAKFRSKQANQHTYQGLPVDELATYLIEQQSFTRDDVMRRFGITQPKQVAIAEELERHQVLVRGEKNARVLNTITREQLVRQLRDNFPLAFHEGEWAERNGSWERHLRDRERQEQKERAQVERLQTKVGKLKAEAQELTAFQRVLARA